MEIALKSLRLLAFRVSTVVALMTVTVVTARWLGPEGRGIYALVLLYSSVGVTLLGGLGSALAYQISNLRLPVRSVLTNAGLLALAIGDLALVICLAIRLLTGDGGLWWLVVAGAAQPPLLLATALTWGFLATDDHRAYNRAIIAPSALSLLAILLLMGGQRLLTGETSVQTALLAWLLAQCATVAWLLWLGRAWLPPALDAVRPEALGGMVVFAAQTGIADLISFLNYKADVFLLDLLRGTAEVGVYSVAVQIAEGLWFISSAVGVVIYARVGNLPAKDAAALTAKSMRHAVLIIALMGIGLMLVAGIAFPLAFGSEFGEAVTAFRLLVPGIVIFGLGRIFSTFYTNALGRPRIPLLIAATSLGVSVPLCFLLIPPLGMNGAALATTISYTAAMVLAVALFHRDTGTPVREIVLVSREDLRSALEALRRFRAGRARPGAGQPRQVER